MSRVALGASALGIADVAVVARGKAQAELAPQAREAMQRSRDVVERFTAEDRPVYA